MNTQRIGMPITLIRLRNIYVNWKCLNRNFCTNAVFLCYQMQDMNQEAKLKSQEGIE